MIFFPNYSHMMNFSDLTGATFQFIASSFRNLCALKNEGRSAVAQPTDVYRY